MDIQDTIDFALESLKEQLQIKVDALVADLIAEIGEEHAHQALCMLVEMLDERADDVDAGLSEADCDDEEDDWEEEEEEEEDETEEEEEHVCAYFCPDCPLEDEDAE